MLQTVKVNDVLYPSRDGIKPYLKPSVGEYDRWLREHICQAGEKATSTKTVYMLVHDGNLDDYHLKQVVAKSVKEWADDLKRKSLIGISVDTTNKLDIFMLTIGKTKKVK